MEIDDPVHAAALALILDARPFSEEGLSLVRDGKIRLLAEALREHGRGSVALPYGRNDLFKRLCKLGTPINCLVGAARSAMGASGRFYPLNEAWADNLVGHAEKAKEAWDGIVALFDDEQGRRGSDA